MQIISQCQTYFTISIAPFDYPLNFFLHLLSSPNSAKTKSGANGKFLPKSRIFSCWKIPLPRLLRLRSVRPCEATLLTLLFHLRHPNSKTNQPRFWQILSPKNSFCKTSSALKPRHTARISLRAEPQKEKCPFHFQEKLHPRQIKRARNIFLWCPPRLCEAVAGLSWSVRFSFKPLRAPRVAHQRFWKWVRAWYNRDTKTELNGFFKARRWDALRASRISASKKPSSSFVVL